MPDFNAIYEQQVNQVYGFFGYLLRSREDAEDLTQLTFERALRGWDSYEESRAKRATWLMAIARNLYIDHMRARARRPAATSDGSYEDVTAPPDRHRLGLDPEIERALAELGPRERELIALRFGADFTSTEIATLTGLRPANVQQIVARALRRMRMSLESGGHSAEARVAAR